MHENYEFKSDFALREQAKGRVENARQMLVMFARRRGLNLTPEQQSRIASCDDPEKLVRWADRAFGGAEEEEIFREDA